MNAVKTSEPMVAADHGLIFHVMVLTHFVMKDTLDSLVASKRYPKLTMTYERYIPVLVEGDISPGELAARVGISKQACSKVIKELENQGFIERHPNPEDGRSMLLSLSATGLQLLKDGTRVTAEVQERLTAQVGPEQIDLMIYLLEKVCRGMGVNVREYPLLKQTTAELDKGKPTMLNVLLQVLTNHFRNTLLQEMSSKGFDGLRNNSGQILGMIASRPRRIQYIASVIGVSKQAAAVMAIEFENLGYVIRETDPKDKRQIILRLSPLGEKLVEESTKNLRALESKVQTVLGDADYHQLEGILADLYNRLILRLGRPDKDPAAEPIPDKIRRMTELLIEELGISGARSLARNLLTITRGDI